MSINQKNFKLIILVIVGIIAISFVGKFLINELKTRSTYLYRELKINKDKCVVLNEMDTHGGFHGDGTYYIVLDCSNSDKELQDNISKWNKLPLSENLELIMYGGIKNGITYGYNLSSDANIPQVENGYYYFLDRHSEATNIHSDEELFNRYSFNFSIAIYDSDKKILYYLREDT